MSDETTGGAAAGVDPGPGGFMAIFEGEPGAGGEAEESTSEGGVQEGAAGASAASPERAEDEGYTTADDVVAARFAASLAADGLSIPEPEGDEAEDAGEGVDVASLSEAEIRALAEEALTLKQQQTEGSRLARESEVRSRVEEAEANAVAQVAHAFETSVLARSKQHYTAQLNQRVAGIVRAAKSQDNPDQYILTQVLGAANAVFSAQRQWEAEQAQHWDLRAVQAALEARKRVPELRQLYAERLVEELRLPERAVPELLKTRSIDDFRQRAEELAGIARALGAERGRANQQRRQDANSRLREAPVRTTANARQPGGKPPEYKGTADEGVRILALMHSG